MTTDTTPSLEALIETCQAAGFDLDLRVIGRRWSVVITHGRRRVRGGHRKSPTQALARAMRAAGLFPEPETP